MFISMRIELMAASFIPEQNAFTRNDFPDTTQLQIREFLLPGIQQFHRLFAGHGEQQFKIFSVGQRRQRGWFVAVAVFVRTRQT